MPDRETHLRAAMYSSAGHLLHKVPQTCIVTPAASGGDSNESQGYGNSPETEASLVTLGTACEAGGAKPRDRRVDRWVRAGHPRPLKAASVVPAGRTRGGHGRSRGREGPGQICA